MNCKGEIAIGEAIDDNGTLQLRRTTPSGGATLETWNIRNLRPGTPA